MKLYLIFENNVFIVAYPSYQQVLDETTWMKTNIGGDPYIVTVEVPSGIIYTLNPANKSQGEIPSAQ